MESVQFIHSKDNELPCLPFFLKQPALTVIHRRFKIVDWYIRDCKCILKID